MVHERRLVPFVGQWNVCRKTWNQNRVSRRIALRRHSLPLVDIGDLNRQGRVQAHPHITDLLISSIPAT